MASFDKVKRESVYRAVMVLASIVVCLAILELGYRLRPLSFDPQDYERTTGLRKEPFDRQQNCRCQMKIAAPSNLAFR